MQTELFRPYSFKKITTSRVKRIKHCTHQLHRVKAGKRQLCCALLCLPLASPIHAKKIHSVPLLLGYKFTVRRIQTHTLLSSGLPCRRGSTRLPTHGLLALLLDSVFQPARSGGPDCAWICRGSVCMCVRVECVCVRVCLCECACMCMCV